MSGVITIEQGNDQEPFDCPCCGGRSQTVVGFVYKDDDAHAVYYAGWSDGHADQGMLALISIGEWGGDDADPTTRRSVGLYIRVQDGQPGLMVIDAEETSWSDDPDFLGTMLTREQALALDNIGDYFHVAEHMVRDDERVGNYLNTR